MANNTENSLFEPNEAYNAAYPIWQKCRDTSAGEDALHARDLSVQGTYLRPLNPSNQSQANIAKNKAYILMARYQNFVGSTKAGFLGMAYRTQPVVPELPERMQYLIENVNGVGLSLEQQSRKTLSEVIEVGRDGLLTEMPFNEGNVTIADEQAGMRPSIATYLAESIIDWFPFEPSVENPLQYVILKEESSQRVDGEFEHQKVVVYRVLHIHDGAYHQTLFKSDTDGNFPSGDQGVRTQIFAANQMPMREIPFTFVGSLSNTPSIDKPIILDIANASLGMYQEDANLRVSSFGFSAGTLVVSDSALQRSMDPKNPDKPAGIGLGDGQALLLGDGGKAEIITPPDNPLAAKIKETDQKNLAELGAQIVMDSGGVTSIIEVASRNSVNASKLTVGVENVSAAYNQQLAWCAEFLGVEIDSDKKFTINTEFFSAEKTAEEITAIIASWQSGLISKSVAQDQLQKAGNIANEVDLEEMNEIIDNEPSSGINFDSGAE
jgi:hypothetical protein